MKLKRYHPYRYVPPGHRAYLRDHSIAFWLVLGLFVYGALGLSFPSTVLYTPLADATPIWIQKLYYTFFLIGGISGSYGMFYGKTRFEAAGMVLIAIGFLISLITIADAAPSTFASESFRLVLVIGCVRRAQYLCKNRNGVLTLINWSEAVKVEETDTK
jgi:hypothetical protein